MDLAKAMRPEHAFQRVGVEVGQVRRREAALPQPVEGAVDTAAAEEAREPEQDALAAGNDEDEEASGRKPLEARRGRLSRRRKMLEDVVKADDVEHRMLGQASREEAGNDRKPVAPRLSGDGGIRFETGREIATASGRLQEPPVRAADVQEPRGTGGAKGLERVQHEFEVVMPETVEGLPATRLVDCLVARAVFDRRCQRGREKAAASALVPVAPIRARHGGLADEAVHR